VSLLASQYGSEVILESVPNVSEGRDPEKIDRIARSLGSVLIDAHSDPDHHRTVLTAAGTAGALEEALTSLATTCIVEIDLRTHDGLHPRFGALDVVPLVPLSPDDQELAFALAARLAQRFSALHLGVFRYGDGSLGLPEVRRAIEAATPPDLGSFHPSAGATCVGVRAPLVAFNVDLDPRTTLAEARAVAKATRTESVRALGLVLPRQGRVQISMNLTAPCAFTVEAAWRRVSQVTSEKGLSAPTGAELVGLAPAASLANLSDELAALTGAREKVLENRILETGRREGGASRAGRPPD
jgi:glutamate formiminotransferase / 5-formyltetrahydrofolate cyclo-ligase